ncbi:type II secretion system F family protein [Pseudomonas chlororaphis]|uniref:Type IV pilus biogenesis protein n=1 Tax=Pseudomonas chlororaphis TaxID=587753 RepID=A0AAX3FWM1_9PSED|nr:type II secretion system F family protein [Pseudomonas chlororaphis]AZC39415.1 Conjugative transfer protein PilR in PFGI-1-like cluster [Pseudomonas chlororaphis subsp. piscium]AZC45967.1 Conjugative transfer protein PilR in PFGI-1-like cluster [Pseudomonas chlororaphis subsp. piscium]WDG71501.1 type II secretion system F family protein [Pseudomonas chlororaphis]WDH30715.1 type II secretion system F family protein [Pseudomonas chlororaphis]WDH70026.1 type II secretion system F family protei
MLDAFHDFRAGLKEAARGWVESFYAKQFGKKERIQFYESLMGVLEDGIPIEVALETVEKAFSNDGKELHPVSIICNEIAMTVRGGKSLAHSCRSRVPYDEASLIETGEETGNLVQAFRDCVRIIEIRQRIARLVRSVVALPSLTWSLMWALLYVIAFWMVPSMSRRSDPESWTGIPAMLYHISNIVSSYGVVIVIALLTLILTAVFTLPIFCGLKIKPDSPAWQVQISRILQLARLRLESFPPWSLYKVLHGSIFLLNMSVMLRTGINQLDALSILNRSAPPWLRERLDAIHYGVSSGKNFGEALKLAGHQFPDAMAIHYLEVLATRKGFAESMERFANRWLEQTLLRVDAISKFLIVMSSVCMGVLMILVVIGIFQMAGSVMDSARF